MTKNQQKSDKLSVPPVNPALTDAVRATMPLLYSLQIAQLQQTSGPIPHPDILKKYDDFRPGLAEKIVKMADDEAVHRRKIEADIAAVQGQDLKAYRRAEMAGQFFGLIIGLAALGFAAHMAEHGAQIAASFVGAGGITGLVTAFIAGRSLLLKQQAQEFRLRQEAIHQQQAALTQKK